MLYVCVVAAAAVLLVQLILPQAHPEAAWLCCDLGSNVCAVPQTRQQAEHTCQPSKWLGGRAVQLATRCSTSIMSMRDASSSSAVRPTMLAPPTVPEGRARSSLIVSHSSGVRRLWCRCNLGCQLRC